MTNVHCSILKACLIVLAVLPLIVVIIGVLTQSLHPARMHKIEILKRYSDSLNDRVDREYQLVEEAVGECQEHLDDRSSFYQCLIKNQLTSRQIAILEQTTEENVRQILEKASPKPIS